MKRVAFFEMQVTVNGEPRDLAAPVSVAELLRDLAVPPGRVAVEVNEEVVPRGAYGERRLAAGDRVEIVHFVGGG
jgi:thiamine biosynthesis protein ThiS